MAERILVAMSGGVDSSVTAALLHKQGFDVVGARMRLVGPSGGGSTDKPEPHRPEADFEDARAVAEQIGIPFHVVELQGEFERLVIGPFVEEYLCGRTPNPCVRCNPALKLGLLFEKAQPLGCTAMATGHYARIERRADLERWGMRRGVDAHYEQSYYLQRLGQEQLAHFRAPLGDRTKEEVRRLARDFGLPVAEKPGSQEICFVPANNYRDFVRRHPLGEAARIEPGEIVDRHGNVLGRHTGIVDYTVGQRRGLGIAHPTPLYVVALDPRANRVIVGEKSEVFARGLLARDVNWVSAERPSEPFRARVQIRYRHASVAAAVEPLDNDGARVTFDAPQPAVAPGQATAFYDQDDEWLLGGGWIESAEKVGKRGGLRSTNRCANRAG